MRLPEYRYGALEVREKSFSHVCVDARQEDDFSVKSTQGEPAKSSEPIPTSAAIGASIRYPLSSDEIKLPLCLLGQLCWPATVSRPDMSLQGCDIYRIDDLVKTAKEW